MSSSHLDALLARMPDIVSAVERFESEHLQRQVLAALLAAYERGEPVVAGAVEIPPQAGQLADVGNPPVKPKGAPVPKKSSVKGKATFTIDKNLDLVRGGTSPFDSFVEDKQPQGAKERCLVAVYWLTRIASSPAPVTVDQVYTCFKHMNWIVPMDLVNTLQKAGSMGWLDTKKREDLKVVVGGENYVEHAMPGRSKSDDLTNGD